MSSQLKYPVPTPPTPSVFFLPPLKYLSGLLHGRYAVWKLWERSARDMFVQHSSEHPRSAAITTTTPMQSSAVPCRTGAGMAKGCPHAAVPTPPWLGREAVSFTVKAVSTADTNPVLAALCESGRLLELNKHYKTNCYEQQINTALKKIDG